MRSIRSRRCRPSTPSGPVIPRRKSCRPCVSWASASCPTARWAAVSSPAPCARSTHWTPLTSAAMNPRFQGDNLEANQAIVDLIDALAAAKGCTPAQVALAWVHAQGTDIAPIPGTKRRTYLEDNLGALDVEFTRRRAVTTERHRRAWRALPRHVSRSTARTSMVRHALSPAARPGRPGSWRWCRADGWP